MVRTKLCVEGGGSRTLNRACRQGFGRFLTRAGVAHGSVEVEACGPRGNAYKAFNADLGQGSRVVLLVDAEGPVTVPHPWQHLQASDNWARPVGATNEQCHLMVEAMESWFLADVGTLNSFYGQGFRGQDVPQNPNIEDVSKQDVLDSLERATRGTGKGRYNKGKHSFEILARLDPAKVRSASPYTDRLISALST